MMTDRITKQTGFPLVDATKLVRRQAEASRSQQESSRRGVPWNEGSHGLIYLAISLLSQLR